MKRFDPILTALEAIDHAPDLSPMERTFAKASIRFRPLVRIRVSKAVLTMATECKAIDDDGNVEAAIDWMAFLKLILPIILSLL